MDEIAQYNIERWIEHVSDSLDMNSDLSAELGTWDHFVAYVPLWLAFWTYYCPGDGMK